jgi:tRNA(Met) cytidine acetyltransferase
VSAHRKCLVLRGPPSQTAADEREITRDIGSVLRVGAGATPPAHVRRLLGQSFDAVSLDLHDGFEADVLGQCHGLIRGGGALILRMPPIGIVPPCPLLAVLPFTAKDTGTRFWDRLERCLEGHEAVAPPEPLSPPASLPEGTDEQRRVVDQLTSLFSAPAPSTAVLLADRGRGKSAALGMAVRAVLQNPARNVVVTAPSLDAAAEVFRFAAPEAGQRLRFADPGAVVREAKAQDVIVVDEAAQLPVALLRELVSRHPRAYLAFATTTHGYEGTGRGFVLRFLDWLVKQPRPVSHLSLHEPIRWGSGDCLERLVFQILALDAEPSSPDLVTSPLPQPCILDRDALARNEPLLRSLFGLLVHAHYRTTPSDLQRLVDAPNMAVHAIVTDNHVVAATLVAREGGLDKATCEAVATGKRRIRGHALADTLMTHAARPAAGELSIVRSVRIATHPDLRLQGLARTLIHHVHSSYHPDLFGTVFGATPGLLAFRRAVGYELVRVGASLGLRTGEPAAVMLRPISSAAVDLVAALRQDLARDIPIQLDLLRADGDLGFDPRLAGALVEGLPEPVDLDANELHARIQRYLSGPQTYHGAAYAITRMVEQHTEGLRALPPQEQALVQGRVLDRKSWDRVAKRAGYPNVRAAMRALRPALRKLL